MSNYPPGAATANPVAVGHRELRSPHMDSTTDRARRKMADPPLLTRSPRVVSVEEIERLYGAGQLGAASSGPGPMPSPAGVFQKLIPLEFEHFGKYFGLCDLFIDHDLHDRRDRSHHTENCVFLVFENRLVHSPRSRW